MLTSNRSRRMRRRVVAIWVASLAAPLILIVLARAPARLTPALPGSDRTTVRNEAARQGAFETSTPSPCSVRPKILSRNEWGAKDPVGKMKPHTPDRITIHHTASHQRRDLSLDQKMRDLQKFSQNPSQLAGGRTKPVWPDVPYHFYISFDGKIAQGRDVSFVGDTNTDYNPAGHILIVLEGNFDEEQVTSAQMDSLRCLATWLIGDWRIPRLRSRATRIMRQQLAREETWKTSCQNFKKCWLLPAARRGEENGFLSLIRGVRAS
jgi:hypothetical protein